MDSENPPKNTPLSALDLSIVTTGTPPARTDGRCFTVLPRGAAPLPGGLVDADGVLVPWLRRHRATTIALRPDGFVYSAARKQAA